MKNLKLEHQDNKNNFHKFSKLTEYLKHTKAKYNNFIQKNSLHKKNCLSSGGEDKNLLFNLNNYKNRITKKKITLNKNLKITIQNGNVNSNSQNTKHIKNKTFDYNSIIQTNNNLTKKNINAIKITEEFNSLLNKKPKQILSEINLENMNNIQKNNKTNNSKINKKIDKYNVIKKDLMSPTNKKIFNKISMTQNNSKEKNNKKNLNVKILNPNNKRKQIDLVKKISNNPKHKKNNKSEICINNNKNILIESTKISKTNFNLNSNNSNAGKNYITNINSKNIAISPKNEIFKSMVYLKRNILINSYNNNTELYQNVTSPTDSNNNNICFTSSNENNNNNGEKNNISRNKKKISNKISNCKKSNIHIKTNSSVNNKPIINSNTEKNCNKNLINNNRNINISIEKNNINIKDSILHIDKIYIKRENSFKKKSKKSQKIDEEESEQNKKTIEIKVDDEIIRTVGNDIKLNKERMKSMDYSPFKINYSPKIINVHRNFNLITKNNNK